MYQIAVDRFANVKRIESGEENRYSWHFLGPDHIAGRMLSLAIHPFDTSILWAGSASGGLWYSASGGIGEQAWRRVKVTYPVCSFSAIALHPQQPDTILVGTGEVYHSEEEWDNRNIRTLRGFNGIGILRSVDAGASWEIVLDWKDEIPRGINKIVFNPISPDTVYAATTEGLYQSINGGKSWNQILDKPMISGLLLHSFKPHWITVGVGGLGANDYGIFQSKDAGKNWRKIQLPDTASYQGKIMLAHQSKRPDYICAILSDKFRTIRFIRTINFFENLFYHNLPDIASYQGWYANGLAIHDLSANKILAGGVDLFLDEKGAGNQFERLYPNETKVHVDFHDIIKNHLDPEKVYFCTDGGIFRSDNFGKDFYACNGGLRTAQFYAGDLDPFSEGRIIGGLQDNQSVWRDTSGTWSKIGRGDGGSCYFHKDVKDIFYISSQYSNIYRSNDAGKSWKEIKKVDQDASFISPFTMHPLQPNILAATGRKIYHTNDQGQIWKELDFGNPNETFNGCEFDPYNPDILYASSYSIQPPETRLYQIRLNLNHFTRIDATLPNRIISDIEIHPKYPNKILVSFSGYQTDHLYFSDDFGKKWISLQGNLPEIPIHCLKFHPDQDGVLFVGNDFGLFVSQNMGQSWQNFTDESIYIVPVYDLKLDHLRNTLTIFTHGQGAFQMSAEFKTPSQLNTLANPVNEFKVVFQKFELERLMGSLGDGWWFSSQGIIISNMSDDVLNKWEQLSPGIYYFLGKHHRVKCVITH
ncbi:MAG: hypothetical protein IPM48_12385 [Saprospiraceae bacterium]|nr:hypothetical protein [Saprospiraceae bacterium]